eukprot:COSAG05_NODE_354_length_10862_cov_59.954659_13_plen_237_part_00
MLFEPSGASVQLTKREAVERVATAEATLPPPPTDPAAALISDSTAVTGAAEGAGGGGGGGAAPEEQSRGRPSFRERFADTVAPEALAAAAAVIEDQRYGATQSHVVGATAAGVTVRTPRVCRPCALSLFSRWALPSLPCLCFLSRPPSSSRARSLSSPRVLALCLIPAAHVQAARQAGTPGRLSPGADDPHGFLPPAQHRGDYRSGGNSSCCCYPEKILSCAGRSHHRSSLDAPSI